MKRRSCFILLLCVANSGCLIERDPGTNLMVKVPDCNQRLDNVIKWESEDGLTVVGKDGIHRFELQNTDGETAEFVGHSLFGPESYAVFPFSNETGPQNSVVLNIPSIQCGIPGGYDRSALVLAANAAPPGIIEMDCMTALFKVHVDSEEIAAVTLRGLSGEGLSGRLAVRPGKADVLEKVDSIRLVPRRGERLERGDYYVSVFPGTFKRGFYLTLTRTDGYVSVVEKTGLVQMSESSLYEIRLPETDALKWSSGQDWSSSIFSPRNKIRFSSFWGQYLSGPARVHEADSLLKAMTTEGAWPEINYQDPSRSIWAPAAHIDNMVPLAYAFYETGDDAYLAAFGKALSFWSSRAPLCKNWWFNEIYVPKELGPALILVQDCLSRELMDKAIGIMSKAEIKMSGVNKVWLSGNVLLTGFLMKNESMVEEARNAIMEEIAITEGEGIQPDLSYHFHGAQLQLGTYGLQFFSECAKWVAALGGTPLQISEEKKGLLRDFVYNGPYRAIWNGYLDMNACGRQVDIGRQVKQTELLFNAMELMGLEQENIVGAFYYPYSDFGIYRGEEWYASIRMQSNRTIGFEMTNSENMRGYFSSDGSCLVRRSGDEYYDVSASWDWHHVPGVTAYDDGNELYGCTATPPYNCSDLVFGAVNGDYMVAAMDLDRDGLTGRKAWFFSPWGFVCLGTGISRSGSDRVTTAVEQCRIKSEVSTGMNWIHHNGITYVALEGTEFKLAPREHTGDWQAINPTYRNDPVSIDLLDIYIDHGTTPENQSYAYAVIPDGHSYKEALSFIDGSVHVASNTPSYQEVKIGVKKLLVDWNNGRIEIN